MKKRIKRISKVTLLLLYLPVLILFLLSNFAYLFNPHEAPLMGVMGLLFPLFFAVFLAFTGFWVYRGKRIAIWSVLIAATAWIHLPAEVQLFSSKGEDSNLTVMTFNARMWYPYDGSTRAEMIAQVNGFVKDYKPNLLFIQEHRLTGESSEIDLPHRAFKPMYNSSHLGYGVYSTYPISASGFVDFHEERNGYKGVMWADLNINGKTVRAINVHLVNTALTPESYQTLSGSDTELTREQLETEGKDIYRRLTSSYRIRGSQSVELVRFIKDTPYPIVLCGDFNDTPTSHVYGAITDHLDDAFVTAGKGFGDSFNRLNIVPLRIDYIFTSPEIECQSFQIIKSKVSDHKPMVATFTLP